MFENCHTPDDVVCVYRALGFTVTCVGGRVALIATPRLGGVAVPSYLAHGVRSGLDVDATPTTTLVIGRSRSGPETEQIFLVGPAAGRRFTSHVLDQLDDAGVRILDVGQRIWLPMTDSSIGWKWLGTQPSLGIRLPSATSVLTAAHDLLLATRRGTLP